MQKIATRIFIYASIAFGAIGILAILLAPLKDSDSGIVNVVLMKMLVICGFIILPSFALSVAGKYLDGRL